MKFILVCFVALCLYELVVFLYFKFVKEDSKRRTKGEMRKMRETVVSQEQVRPHLSSSSVMSRTRLVATHPASSDGWEDLIGYKRGVQNNAANETPNRRECVVDAFFPGETHADFRKSDEEILRSMDDLFGTSTSQEEVKNATECQSLKIESLFDETAVVQTEEQKIRYDRDESDAEKSILSEFDFSNMMK